MIKRMIDPSPRDPSPAEDWLNLADVAEVELTSEDARHPIESALLPGSGSGSGWRASLPGEQVVRLVFGEPRKLRRIRLLFDGEGQTRTQQFVVRWSSDGGASYREVVRQQYNFSPQGAVQEIEDYGVELDGVTALELRIVPDLGGTEARASLKELRLA